MNALAQTPLRQEAALRWHDVPLAGDDAGLKEANPP